MGIRVTVPERTTETARALLPALGSYLLPGRERLAIDPLPRPSTANPRYRPIPIDRLKVGRTMKELILDRRRTANSELAFDTGRLAVIIPYRDRATHLEQLLPRLEHTLASQVGDYCIFVVEQLPGRAFNRGGIKNVGALLAQDEADYLCFHDVDMLPETADYRRPSQPLRLVKTFTSTPRKQPVLDGYMFGGVISLRTDQFFTINGYDSQFWGWGDEDENLFLRCLMHSLVPYEDLHGRFVELANPSDESGQRNWLMRRRNRFRMKQLMLSGRVDCNGVVDQKYELGSLERDGRIVWAKVII